MVAWPDLPTTEYLPITYTPVDQRAIFQTDAGGPKVASLSTSQLGIVTFDCIFQGADWATFWNWFRDDLANGASFITGLEGVGVDGQDVVYQFAELPTWTMLSTGPPGGPGARRWRTTFKLWQISA